MGRSERYALAATLCLSVGACNAIAGLGDFQEVPCEPCADGAANDGNGGSAEDVGPLPEGAADAVVDASLDAPGTIDSPADGLADVVDAGETGSLPQSDAEAGVSIDRRWARWIMPNPDVDGDGGSALPNQASYVAETEGTVTDGITTLVWTRVPLGAATFIAASTACMTPWRVPTRIELVTLLDTSRSPTVNPVFDVGSVTLWTSSVTPDGRSWTIDFGSGAVVPSVGSAVLCVQGGP